MRWAVAPCFLVFLDQSLSILTVRNPQIGMIDSSKTIETCQSTKHKKPVPLQP